MVVDVNKEKLPFHEAVLEIIPEAEERQLEVIGTMLMIAVVPARHEEISAAWRKRCAEISFPTELVEAVANSVGR